MIDLTKQQIDDMRTSLGKGAQPFTKEAIDSLCALAVRGLAVPEALRSGETPRTDAKVSKVWHDVQGGHEEMVYASFARQLEREVADEIRTVDALQREIERLLSIPSPLRRSQEEK